MYTHPGLPPLLRWDKAGLLTFLQKYLRVWIGENEHGLEVELERQEDDVPVAYNLSQSIQMTKDGISALQQMDSLVTNGDLPGLIDFLKKDVEIKRKEVAQNMEWYTGEGIPHIQVYADITFWEQVIKLAESLLEPKPSLYKRTLRAGERLLCLSKKT